MAHQRDQSRAWRSSNLRRSALLLLTASLMGCGGGVPEPAPWPPQAGTATPTANLDERAASSPTGAAMAPAGTAATAPAVAPPGPPPAVSTAAAPAVSTAGSEAAPLPAARTPTNSAALQTTPRGVSAFTWGDNEGPWATQTDGLSLGDHACLFGDGTGTYNRVCRIERQGRRIRVVSRGSSLNPQQGFEFAAHGGPARYTVSGVLTAFDGCSGPFNQFIDRFTLGDVRWYAAHWGDRCQLWIRHATTREMMNDAGTTQTWEAVAQSDREASPAVATPGVATPPGAAPPRAATAPPAKNAAALPESTPAKPAPPAAKPPAAKK